jgi:hypothetical protein
VVNHISVTAGCHADGTGHARYNRRVYHGEKGC